MKLFPKISKLAFLFMAAMACCHFFSACITENPEDKEKKRKESLRVMDADSLYQQKKDIGYSAGLQLPDSLKNDSMKNILKERLLQNMENIISENRKKFPTEYFTGYFLTDLDKDGFQELWLKTGHNRQNSRLQLFYPKADGTYKTSTTLAEPGNYYLGDGYLIQVVTSGPGFISCNYIRISSRGEMDIENFMEIDKYETPDKEVPVFKEPAIKDKSLSSFRRPK